MYLLSFLIRFVYSFLSSPPPFPFTSTLERLNDTRCLKHVYLMLLYYDLILESIASSLPLAVLTVLTILNHTLMRLLVLDVYCLLNTDVVF